MNSARHTQKTSAKALSIFNTIIARMETWGAVHEGNQHKHISSSKRLKTCNALLEISDLFSEMLGQNIFPNTVIINQLIKKLQYLKLLDFALRVHRIAVAKNLTDAVTYNTTIDTVAKSHEPNIKLVLILFNRAKELGFADTVTYNSTIDAIAKRPEPNAELAIALFNEAKTRNFANTFTYNRTIDAIAKGPTPDIALALSLLSQAKAEGLANAITYRMTLDAIAKNPILSQHFGSVALSILDEATQRFDLHPIQRADVMDLHDLSYGEAYFSLKKRLAAEVKNKHASSIDLQVIYGRGLHSQTGPTAEPHPLKEATIRILGEMSDQGISGRESPDNPGRFNLAINPCNQKIPSQTGVLIPNSIFGGEPRGDATKLPESSAEASHEASLAENLYLPTTINPKRKFNPTYTRH